MIQLVSEPLVCVDGTAEPPAAHATESPLREIRVYPKLVCNFAQSPISGPDQNRLIEDGTAYELKIGDADSSSVQLLMVDQAEQFLRCHDRSLRQEGEVSQHLFTAGYRTQSQLQADVWMCHDLVIL